MKIGICLRTLNETRNIERFCQNHQWADATILVADGGSTDNTVSLASQFPNVLVRSFPEMVEGENNTRRNPEGRHLNFLYSWAKEIGMDWIISDDCDSFPTKDMKTILPEVFYQAEREGKTGILAYHIYIYGADKYFPDMNKTGQCMRSWRVSTGASAVSSEEWGVCFNNFPKRDACVVLERPYCWLHFFCPDPETTERKYRLYKDSGKMGVSPIIESCGPLVPLEPWMVE